ncbi:MAG: hypothetical protein WC974_04585 [Thermoplasmata archaeon]
MEDKHDKPIPETAIIKETFISPGRILYGGDPWTKDIFMEVDWMKDPGGWGGIGAHEHKMSFEAQGKVIRAFANHYIALHIDDGWMGGGTSVTHYTDNIPYNSQTQFDIFNFKGGETTDLNGDGVLEPRRFSVNRYDIFHYCVYVHSIDGGEGKGDVGGDTFAIGKGVISSIPREAVCFMHELGHNLLGGPPNHFIVDPNGGRHCGDQNCVMYYTGSTNNNLNYCSDCWNALDLAGSF